MIDAFETDNEVNIGGDTKSVFFIDLQVISVAEFVPGELFRLFDQYRQEVGGARRSLSSLIIITHHHRHHHRRHNH